MTENAALEILLLGSPTVARQLQSDLSELGHKVVLYAQPQEALRAWALGRSEVALLAVAAWDEGQFLTIRAFREQSPHAPVLVASASGTFEDRDRALRAGADDYISTPYPPAVLVARLDSIIRYRASWAPAKIHVGPLLLRAGEPGAVINGNFVEMSPRERLLLEMLALSPGKFVAGASIARRLGTDGESLAPSSVQLHVHRLRRRLSPFQLRITTSRNIGYRLELTEQTTPDVPLTEQALEPEPQWWNTRLLEYTNDAIIIWEMQGRGILYWNRAAEQLYGYSRTEAAGRSTHELLKTSLAGGVTQLETNLGKYGVWIGELTHTRNDGRRVQVEGRLTLMPQQNERWLVLEVNRDITDRKALESSRGAMQRKLQELLSTPR